MPTEIPPQTAATLWAQTPLVISALHLPNLAAARGTSMAQLEDYVLANTAVFVEAGVPAMMLQDSTFEPAGATPDTVAVMAALGRMVRLEYPNLQLGIIIQAHDPAAAIAVAHSVGAAFVRIKVFVGGVMAAEGPKDAIGTQAVTYRHNLNRPDIAILADVHDRTSYPRSDMPHDQAAFWAQQVGADGLILTGGSFDETLDRIGKARAAGVTVPILVGGGVTASNVDTALAHADGVIVSRAMMKPDTTANDRLHWDVEAARRFMRSARPASASR